MAGKRVISSETGAEISQTYQQTLPDLLWYFKRSLAGSVNQLVIHGYPYSGQVWFPQTRCALTLAVPKHYLAGLDDLHLCLF